MGSGVVTEANRRLLRHHQFNYVVSHNRPRAAWAEEFSKDGFTALPGRKTKTEIQVTTSDKSLKI